jgi:hypothetical protein
VSLMSRKTLTANGRCAACGEHVRVRWVNGAFRPFPHRAFNGMRCDGFAEPAMSVRNTKVATPVLKDEGA